MFRRGYGQKILEKGAKTVNSEKIHRKWTKKEHYQKQKVKTFLSYIVLSAHCTANTVNFRFTFAQPLSADPLPQAPSAYAHTGPDTDKIGLFSLTSSLRFAFFFF